MGRQSSPSPSGGPTGPSRPTVLEKIMIPTHIRTTPAETRRERTITVVNSLTVLSRWRDASPLGNLSSFRGQGPLSRAQRAYAWLRHGRLPACASRERMNSSISYLFAISCSSLAARRNSFASLEGYPFFLRWGRSSHPPLGQWPAGYYRPAVAHSPAIAPLSPEIGATSSAKASCLLTDHSRCLLVAAQA